MSVETAAVELETVLSSEPDQVWQVEVDQATAAEWSQNLDLFDDANIYQTWSYGNVRWGRKNLSHLVLRRNGEVVAMAQLRIVRPTPLKFGMAYLRWGPICQGKGRDLEQQVLARMALALDAEYVAKRSLLLHVIPNAFAGSPRSEIFQSAFSRFTQEAATCANTYRTFVLDLAPSLEELRRKLDPKWRNKLSGAEKKGLRVISGDSIDLYRSFCEIYQQMRNRKVFETTVDVEEFARIQKDLPETHRMRVLLCEQNGKLVAGIVASAMGDSAIYLLGATSDDGLDAKGSYLLQWTLIESLKNHGVRWYDLGGIDPETNPGVYQFKRGFSGADVCQLTPFVACRSLLSSAAARAGLAMNRTVQSLNTFNIKRTVKFSG
jgi:lipid II:glycine glycyltransferase (peptidoglycan interpeptide bridge formation enzyme)